MIIRRFFCLWSAVSPPGKSAGHGHVRTSVIQEKIDKLHATGTSGVKQGRSALKVNHFHVCIGLKKRQVTIHPTFYVWHFTHMRSWQIEMLPLSAAMWSGVFPSLWFEPQLTSSNMECAREWISNRMSDLQDDNEGANKQIIHAYNYLHTASTIPAATVKFGGIPAKNIFCWYLAMMYFSFSSGELLDSGFVTPLPNFASQTELTSLFPKAVITERCPGGHSSNSKERTREMWDPSWRCTPEHTMHMRAPKLILAHIGSNKKANTLIIITNLSLCIIPGVSQSTQKLFPGTSFFMEKMALSSITQFPFCFSLFVSLP